MRSLGFVLGALTLALVAAELALRLVGHVPWAAVPRRSDDPIMYEPDPVLGWRPREGRYTLRGFTPGAPPIRVTRLADGSRWSGRAVSAAAPQVIFLGCSYTEGYAVDDAEAYPSRIQAQHGGLRVSNLAATAYGTYQSLLVFERALAEEPAPALALYGYLDLHEARNVGDPLVLERVARSSQFGVASLPFCTLGEGGALVGHPPEGFQVWPLANRLSTLTVLQRMVARMRSADRAQQARAVTTRLLRRMGQQAAARGTRFAVVFLSGAPASVAWYRDRLAPAEVALLDCRLRLSAQLRVAGQGHPNAAAHAHWARCIGAQLPGLLAGVPAAVAGSEAAP